MNDCTIYFPKVWTERNVLSWIQRYDLAGATVQVVTVLPMRFFIDLQIWIYGEVKPRL